MTLILIFRVVRPSYISVKIRRDNNTQTLKTNITNADIPSIWNGIPVETYAHRDYGLDERINDLAIIEFPEGYNLNVTPVILAKDYQEKKGDFGIAAGYGVYMFTSE